MICQDRIEDIRTDISDRVGQKIIIKGSTGKRSQPFEKEATIEKVYPYVFRIKYEERSVSETYQYQDLLTGDVKVDVFDGNGYSPLLPPKVETKKQKNLA